MQKFKLGPSKGEKKKSPANKTDTQWEQLQVWRENNILTLFSTAWYLLLEQND